MCASLGAVLALPSVLVCDSQGNNWLDLCASYNSVEPPPEARTFSLMLHACLGLVGGYVLCCLYSRTQAAAMKHFFDKKVSNSV